MSRSINYICSICVTSNVSHNSRFYREKFCPGNPVSLPFHHASTSVFLAEMLCGMVTDINNVAEKGEGGEGTKIISCHRVYGSLASVKHRERGKERKRDPRYEARERDGYAKATRTKDFIFERGGCTHTHTYHIQRIHVGAANTRRIRQRQYVLGRSPCQRHCRSPMDGGGEGGEKKGKTRKREKIRLGINADLTLDDWSLRHCTRGWMIRGRTALAFFSPETS